jgi:hypothetical protein
MQRGSDQHGPRLDDQMKAEVEGLVRSGHSTHADEFLDPEPAGEDEPEVDLTPNGTLAGGVPDGMTEEEVAARAELGAALGRVYPADREALLARATENNAPDRLLAELRRLPEGHTFETLHDVWTALGHHVEEHRF